MYICVSPNPVSVIRSRWLEGNHLSCPVFECGGSEWVSRDKQTTHSLTKREGWKRVCGYSFKIVRYVCVCVQLEMYASPRYVTIPTDESDLCVQMSPQKHVVCTDESDLCAQMRLLECVYRSVKSVCADESPPRKEDRKEGRKEGRKEASKKSKEDTIEKKYI